MGSLLHPVGPEQVRVYWFRRALVLLVALVLVGALVWWLWPKPPGTVSAIPPTSGSTPKATGPLASSTPSSSATPGTPASSAPASSTPTTPAAPQACDPASVRLSVAGFERVKLSGKQVFALAVVNGGQEPCILTLDAKTYSLTITSGSDRIWTTAHCGEWVPAKKVTLKPETAHEFEITWALQRSKSECKATKDKLKAGTYVATATFADKVTAKQVMQLVN